MCVSKAINGRNGTVGNERVREDFGALQTGSHWLGFGRAD